MHQQLHFQRYNQIQEIRHQLMHFSINLLFYQVLNQNYKIKLKQPFQQYEELQQKFASYNNVGLLIPETTGQLDFPRLNSLLRAVGPPKVPT